MSKFYMVSIRDRAMDSFGPPFCTPQLSGGIRSFTDAVRRTDPENMMRRHPEDFDLYLVGTFEDSTGELAPLDPPRQISIGKDAAAVPHSAIKP